MGTNRREYLQTASGQAWAWRNRQLRHVRMQVNGPLESKNSSSDESRAKFQKEIAKQLKKQHRFRAFRVPIILQMDLTPALSSPPPAIYSLAKHYLDLLQQPTVSSGLKQTRLLLKDDRLVKLLICNYSFHGNRPGIRIRAATLNDFVLDLQLYQKIMDRNFDDRGSSGYADDWPSTKFSSDLSEVADSYHNHLQNKESYRVQGRQEMWERLHLMNKRHLQEELLKSHQLTPEQLVSIFHRSGFVDAQWKTIDEALIASLRELLMRALVAIDLGTPAGKKGDTKLFKNSVHKALTTLRKERPSMFPLLTTAGVTILHVPAKESQGIDLDNLARKVIPLVHAELCPPATLFHALTPLELGNSSLKDEWPFLMRVPKDHITAYRVMEVPRSNLDPAPGAVKMILHSGAEKGFGPWNECDQIIREWESRL